MEQAEWGRHRPLSVTPEPEPEPSGTPRPSLFALAADEATGNGDAPPARPVPAGEATETIAAAQLQSSQGSVQQQAEQSTTTTTAHNQGRSTPPCEDDGAYEDVDFTVEGSGPTPKYMALRIFKVVMIGDSGAGKTTFIQRLCKGSVDPSTRTTVGVDYFSKQVRVDNQETSLKIWDTAGTEKYRAISRSFLRDADAVILMYDVTSSTSFTSVHSWMVDVQEKARPSVVVMVTGNKIDVAPDGSSSKTVPQDVGSSVAESYNALFAEISALQGDGVQACCVSLARALHKAEDEELSKTRQLAENIAEGRDTCASTQLDTEPSQPKPSGCCT
ncbi:ras-related protein Rab-1C-like [Sycon ciliatum]|uniref:ras-related protein Rab-1C-like n=1 Tax=Sycon ciliatum TaxID=27933 RepID=UPI0031F67B54